MICASAFSMQAFTRSSENLPDPRMNREVNSCPPSMSLSSFLPLPPPIKLTISIMSPSFRMVVGYSSLARILSFSSIATCTGTYLFVSRYSVTDNGFSSVFSTPFTVIMVFLLCCD